MKKLVAIVITFIFIFDATGYCLRPPLIFQNNASSQLKLSSADLIGTPVYKAFDIIDRTKTYDVQVDLRSPGKKYKASSIFNQLGKRFDALNDDDYVAIGLEVLYNGFSSYVVFVDKKREITHKIYRMEPEGITFGLNSHVFLYKLNIYPKYIQLDLISLWVSELRGKNLMSETFKVIANRLIDEFPGKKIMVDARNHVVVGWFEKYFNGKVFQLKILNQERKSIFIAPSSQDIMGLARKLCDMGIFTKQDLDYIDRNKHDMIQSMNDVLAKKQPVLDGIMRPWQYLLYEIAEKGKKGFKGYGAIIMEGVIPEKAIGSTFVSNDRLKNIRDVRDDL